MVSRPVRLPTNRPDLPRASSAMSGFFFCGMIDDPVAQASSSRAQPNSVDVQSTTSSPSRERCTPSSAAAKQNSAAKSRSLTASMRVVGGAVEAELGRRPRPGPGGSDEPASAPAPSGLTAVRRSQSCSRSTSRAIECAWASSWWAMSTGWACCRCVMPGRGDVLVPLGEAEQRELQRRQLRHQRPDVVPQVQPQVGGDLVVAAAPGAELAAERAELLDAGRARAPRARPRRPRSARTCRRRPRRTAR